MGEVFVGVTGAAVAPAAICLEMIEREESANEDERYAYGCDAPLARSG